MCFLEASPAYIQDMHCRRFSASEERAIAQLELVDLFLLRDAELHQIVNVDPHLVQAQPFEMVNTWKKGKRQPVEGLFATAF